MIKNMNILERKLKHINLVGFNILGFKEIINCVITH